MDVTFSESGTQSVPHTELRLYGLNGESTFPQFVPLYRLISPVEEVMRISVEEKPKTLFKLPVVEFDTCDQIVPFQWKVWLLEQHHTSLLAAAQMA